jgi:hypothetical protein
MSLPHGQNDEAIGTCAARAATYHQPTAPPPPPSPPKDERAPRLNLLFSIPMLRPANQLELKGKLSHLIGKEMNDTTLEVRLALEALGYSAKEIHDALKDLNTDNKSTSSIIKEALQQLQ